MPYRNCSDSFSPSDSSSVQHWPLMSCGPTHCEKAIIAEQKKMQPLSIILSSHILSHISLFSQTFKSFKTLLYITSQRERWRGIIYFQKTRTFSKFNLQTNTQMAIKKDKLINVLIYLLKLSNSEAWRSCWINLISTYVIYLDQPNNIFK